MLLCLYIYIGCSPSIRNCRDKFIESGRSETKNFLNSNQVRYQQAISRAKSWLDNITVDPIKLRNAGIKGKKKLVELLNVYVRLHSIAPREEKEKIMKRVMNVVAITHTPEYHDMHTINDLHFKQDATSYLRAAFLMERLGLDTTFYRQEIHKIQSRLNDHMKIRGSHQRMAFHWYYKHFGLKEPFDLAAGFKTGVIASRLDPYDYKTNYQVYQLTHEIFVPYEYGEKLDAKYFSKEDLDYLRHTLDRLTVHYIMKNDPDLTAELVSCIRYLKMTDLAVYRESLEYLLKTQQPDGKWGDYERYRKRHGDHVKHGWYLHTTTVVVDALSIAFHFRDNK